MKPVSASDEECGDEKEQKSGEVEDEVGHCRDRCFACEGVMMRRMIRRLR